MLKRIDMVLKITQSLKKEYSIKNMIHKRLGGWEEARKSSHIHASDLMRESSYCPREQYFINIGVAKKKDEFLGTAMRLTFAFGRHIEESITNDWLRDVVCGNWKCGVCSSVYPSFGKYPTVACSKCGYKQWKYKETRFLSPVSGISGSVDAFIDVGDKKLRLLEIKTIAPDAFKALQAPLAEHRFRTALYLKLVSESELVESERINTQEAHILYIMKAYGIADPSIKEAGISDSGFSPMKEFVIKRDDSLLTTNINKATVLHRCRQDPNLGVPKGVCNTAFEKRAQQCCANKPCFSGQYPGKFTWLEDGKKKHIDGILLPKLLED
jgi:hypothetical protein